MPGRVGWALPPPYAVSAVFALNGALFGNWVARVPDAADRTHSSPAALGLALLGIAAGAITAMPLTGRLCARVDGRYVTTVAATLNCLALPLLALPRSPLVLAAALAGYGAATGATDVSVNTSAVAAVRRAGRPLMPFFHAAFSAGGMAGAAAGGLAAPRLGMIVQFALAAAAGLVIVAVAAPGLPADPPARPARPARPAQPAAELAVSAARRARHWDSTLLTLGGLAFCAAVGEGAVGDWSALFLRRILHTGPSLAAAGFTAFSVAMVTGRLAGTAVLERLGPASTLAGGFGLATVGAVAVVTAPVPALALVGFAAIGAGLATGFPIALNAAGDHSSGSGPAIGLVSTIGYTGFLAGPPLIGLAADATDLRVGLSLVGVAAASGLTLAAAGRRMLLDSDPSRKTTPAQRVRSGGRPPVR